MMYMLSLLMLIGVLRFVMFVENRKLIGMMLRENYERGCFIDSDTNDGIQL